MFTKSYTYILTICTGAPGLRLVVNSLIRSLPAIWNVAIILLMYLAVLGVVGVQLFKDGLQGCNDPSIISPLDCVGSFTVSGASCFSLATERESQLCLINGTGGAQLEREWKDYDSNFNNLFEAMSTLFELSSGEMWNEIMFKVIDARGLLPNGTWLGPERDANLSAAAYFVFA